MKRLYAFLIAVLACVAVEAANHPFAGLSIVDYKIVSAIPESFRAVSGKVDVTINNTETKRTVTEIRANVYRNGTPFAAGKCSDVTFVKGQNKYTLEGTVTLASGVSLWTALGAAFSFDPKEYVVEVTMKMTYEDGTTEIITRKVPVTRFLK